MWNKRKFKLQALKKMEEKTPRVEEYERIEASSKKRMSSKKKWGLISGGLSFAAVLAVTISLVTIRPWENKDEYLFVKQEADYCRRAAYNQVAILEDDIPVLKLDSSALHGVQTESSPYRFETFSVTDAYRFTATFPDYPIVGFPNELIGKDVEMLLALITFNSKKWYDGSFQTLMIIIRAGDYVSGGLGNQFAAPSLWPRENGYLLGKIPYTLDKPFFFSSDLAIVQNDILSTVDIFSSPFSSFTLERQDGVFSLSCERHFKQFSDDVTFEATLANETHVTMFSSFDIRTRAGQIIVNGVIKDDPVFVKDTGFYSVPIDCPQYPATEILYFERAFSYADISVGRKIEVGLKRGDIVSFCTYAKLDPSLYAPWMHITTVYLR